MIKFNQDYYNIDEIINILIAHNSPYTNFIKKILDILKKYKFEQKMLDQKSICYIRIKYYIGEINNNCKLISADQIKKDGKHYFNLSIELEYTEYYPISLYELITINSPIYINTINHKFMDEWFIINFYNFKEPRVFKLDINKYKLTKWQKRMKALNRL